MTRAPIPFTVIGGFLGSGKTTLVNHILASAEGVHITVLVNDFGAVNVDSRLIAATGADTIALTNGCICCSVGDDLSDALIRAITRNPGPDWIVIESSGVSDPWRIAQVGLSDPALLLENVVVLVDGQAVKSYVSDLRLADTILRQLSAADVLVMNKVDLMPDADVESVRSWLARQAPQAWLYETRQARIPHALLRGIPARAVEGSRTIGSQPETRHGDSFAAWTFRTKGLLSAERLRALLQAMPEGIIRAKGIVRTDAAASRASIFQFAGRSRYLKVAGPWTEEESHIVFIASPGTPAMAALRRVMIEVCMRDEGVLRDTDR
jgi:G3E family GTPase